MKFFLITFLVLIDQLSKVYVRELIDKVVITDFFRLYFVENEGIAFSIPLPQWLIISLTIIVLGWLWWELSQTSKFEARYLKHDKGLKIENGLWIIYAYIFLFSGALGNLIDRICLGKVTDFLSFGSFAVFNLADVWINIGVFLFVVGTVREIVVRSRESV